MADLAKKLRAWRKKHNLTREAAAKRLGISVRTLEAYEQRRRGLRKGSLALEGLLARIERASKRTRKKVI